MKNMRPYMEVQHTYNKTAVFDSGYCNWLLGSDHNVVAGKELIWASLLRY